MNRSPNVLSSAVLVGGPVMVPRSPVAYGPAALAQASEVVRKAHEHGFAEGVQAGREQGLIEGREAAAAELRSALEALAAAAGRLDDERRRAAAECQRSALGLALAVARKMVHVELGASAQAAARVVQAAVEQARDAAVVRVRVHPRDKERIETLHPGGLGPELYADPSVAAGGCVVETDCGDVDATVESRWDAVMAAMKDTVAKADSEDDETRQALAETIDEASSVEGRVSGVEGRGSALHFTRPSPLAPRPSPLDTPQELQAEKQEPEPSIQHPASSIQNPARSPESE